MKTIVLKDAVKKSRVDQDKTATQEETLARFMSRVENLGISVFDKVVRVDNGRLGIPVYFSIYGKDARALTGIRKQMGKGGTDQQARASAVMELCERFSFYAFMADSENFRFGTHADFEKDAMPLTQVAASVNDESGDRDAALEFFRHYPQRWAWSTELSTGKNVLVPFDWFFAINEFNGTSAGNGTEEALCQGICEVVERHTSALAAQGLPFPGLTREGVTDPVALDLLSRYDNAGIVIYLSDFTFDMGIPTVAALGFDPVTLGRTSEIVWTAGTCPHPQKALNRALTEVAQLAGDFNSGRVYVASGLPKPKGMGEIGAVINPAALTTVTALPDLSDDNVKIEVENLIGALSARNFNIYAVETTHKGLGIPAFYTMIPGTRFRERAQQASTGLFLARMASRNAGPFEALGLINKMEAKFSPTHYLPFYRGTVNLALDDPESALNAFDEALSGNPEGEDLGSILVYKGMALKEMDRFDEAEKTLTEAASLDPDRTDCLNLLGFCQFKLKDHEAAAETFTKVLALDPGSAMDHANLGVNLAALGKNAEAAESFQRALALDPTIEFARNGLSKLTAKG